MGQGLPFRAGIFDGAISVSALQWLCYPDKAGQSARSRLLRFFSCLYSVLKRGARAALQFYPENAGQVGRPYNASRLAHRSSLWRVNVSMHQVVLITECASLVGFKGGLVIDYPNSSKAKKYYLCLSFASTYHIPKALGGTDQTVAVTERMRNGRRTKDKRPAVKSRDWVLAKKEKQRAQGRDVRLDTKYTGRKRPSSV
jgi:18S rRNA (guanine1575-N7)-methyltransferase